MARSPQSDEAESSPFNPVPREFGVEGVIVILGVRGADGSMRSVAGVFPKAEGGSFKPGDVLTSVKVVDS